MASKKDEDRVADAKSQMAAIKDKYDDMTLKDAEKVAEDNYRCLLAHIRLKRRLLEIEMNANERPAKEVKESLDKLSLKKLEKVVENDVLGRMSLKSFRVQLLKIAKGDSAEQRPRSLKIGLEIKRAIIQKRSDVVFHDIRECGWDLAGEAEAKAGRMHIFSKENRGVWRTAFPSNLRTIPTELEQVLSKSLVLGGETMSALVAGKEPKTWDLYFVGNSTIDERAAEINALIQRVMSRWKAQDTISNSAPKTVWLYRSRDWISLQKGAPINTMPRVIRFSLGMFEDTGALLKSFDVASYAIIYTGRAVYTNALGEIAINRGAVIVDPRCRAQGHEERLARSIDHGFEAVVLNPAGEKVTRKTLGSFAVKSIAGGKITLEKKTLEEKLEDKIYYMPLIELAAENLGLLHRSRNKDIVNCVGVSAMILSVDVRAITPQLSVIMDMVQTVEVDGEKLGARLPLALQKEYYRRIAAEIAAACGIPFEFAPPPCPEPMTVEAWLS